MPCVLLTVFLLPVVAGFWGSGGSGRPAARPLRVTDDETLYNLDNQIEKVYQRMKILKKQKYSILSKNKGLKMHNETEIDNQDYSGGEDEDTAAAGGPPSSFQFPIGISVFLPPSMRENDGAAAAAPPKKTKSEHFHLAPALGYNFSSIGGYEAIKVELLQCADMLLHPEKYKPYSVDVPKGLILEGPPGNGKTHLARCFAGEINVSFIPVSGAQFQEMYIGVGSSRVRELFQFARENTPAIVFIDEIDAIGRRRGHSGGGDESNAEKDATLNQLLVEMDGLEPTTGVFVMGATNRVDLLDDALMRPGRIDKTVYIGLPDRKTRENIVHIHRRGKPLAANLTTEALADMTQGMSGAQIKNWLNEATLLAIRRARPGDAIQTEPADLDFMMNRILVGSQSTEILYNDQTLYQIAVHEMGHAIVGFLLERDYTKLVKVSLNTWSHKSPGFTLFERNEGDHIQSKRYLIAYLSVLLAGRAAEEEFFPDRISTGASQDLDCAKKMAFEMISKYGMGNRAIHAAGSDNSKQEIEKEMNVLIDQAFAKARLIVVHARSFIEESARHLIIEQTISHAWIADKIRRQYPYLARAAVKP
jgi:cell division protease FtsH